MEGAYLAQRLSRKTAVRIGQYRYGTISTFSDYDTGIKGMNWHYLAGAFWIGIALINAGFGVVYTDLWMEALYAGISIASTLLGAAYFWNDGIVIPVFQYQR